MIGRRWRRGLAVIGLVGLAGAALVASSLWRWWSFQVSTPYRGYLEPMVTVHIPEGTSVRRIGVLLEEARVVRSAQIFTVYARLTDGSPLQAGVYRFDKAESLEEVIRKLRRGETLQVRVTIPEGSDLVQIAVILAKERVAQIEDFMEAAANPEEIRDLDPQATDLEGYLFPDTYFFPPDVSAPQIVRRMVANFRRHWKERFERRTFETGWTVREVVTLASLIEKETGVPHERPLVSAVFHNRLRMGMPLMCDPTVIYAVALEREFDGIIHRSDLEIDSPYNTYRYPGLPPGPIANPGLASIEAALEPADVDYLYFVARGDGGHVFSRTYAEHARAVQRYRN
ncbi:MAG TPA: endolytic transglycosylase MltG [Acidobacteriota bacterium]|nr:endolytic transglycosylase MltG [Acidobacteriota bacterium]